MKIIIFFCLSKLQEANLFIPIHKQMCSGEHSSFRTRCAQYFSMECAYCQLKMFLKPRSAIACCKIYKSSYADNPSLCMLRTGK
jgi:hypothetical protein